MGSFGVDLHFSTPYRSQANGRCERHIGEFDKIMRMVRLEQPSVSVIALIPVAVSLLNAQPQHPCGISSFEMFHHGRLQWFDTMLPDVASPNHFVETSRKLVQNFRDQVCDQRTYRMSRDRKPPSSVKVGSHVLVSAKRFPTHPKLKSCRQTLLDK